MELLHIARFILSKKPVNAKAPSGEGALGAPAPEGFSEHKSATAGRRWLILFYMVLELMIRIHFSCRYSMEPLSRW